MFNCLCFKKRRIEIQLSGPLSSDSDNVVARLTVSGKRPQEIARAQTMAIEMIAIASEFMRIHANTWHPDVQWCDGNTILVVCLPPHPPVTREQAQIFLETLSNVERWAAKLVCELK